MDGIHDLGGMHGFGPVPIESQNYTFKYDWQRRAFGIVQAVAGNTPYCADQHRHKIECLSATDYLNFDYFEKWTVATSELLKDAGLVNDSELKSGVKEFSVDLETHGPATPEGLIDAMKQGGDYQFPAHSQPQKFKVSERIRVKSDSPPGHTRVPKYVRGKYGTILASEGVFQFADTVANGEGQNPQHCYLVSFEATELWGNTADGRSDDIVLNLAEAYIDPA